MAVTAREPEIQGPDPLLRSLGGQAWVVSESHTGLLDAAFGFLGIKGTQGKAV